MTLRTRLLLMLAILGCGVVSARAQDDTGGRGGDGTTAIATTTSRTTKQVVSQQSADEPVPLNIFETENAFVFESDLNHGGSFGKQYEAQNEFYYAHRWQISGNVYARAGLIYNRFDFGNTTAPVPVHLQAAAGVISLDYMKGEDIGALLEIRPGIYTEEHIGLAAFDCPITLARFWTIQPDKLYFLTGVNYSFLRGGHGALPVVGLVWKPNEQWKIMAIPPNPRVIYSVSKQLDLYIDGELAGGAFRTDHHEEFNNIPHVDKLSGTQVDFTDYRAGGGLVWMPTGPFRVNLAGGCSIERSFHFARAGETYRTDPSPYVRLEIKALF